MDNTKFTLPLLLFLVGCGQNVDEDTAFVYDTMATRWSHVKVIEDGPHDTSKTRKVYHFLVQDPKDGEVDITFEMKEGRLLLFRALPRELNKKPCSQ